MQQSTYHSISENPKFRKLVRSRTAFAWTLSIVMLLVYQGFILLVAYDKELLAQPLFPGATTTVGIPIGLGVIVFAFLVTGIYVSRANSRYDEMTRELKQEITR